jgi:cell fate regulator YaaT (PSP1 superfamily)
MYRSVREKFPKIGVMVTTKGGKGKVIRHNAIFDRVAVRLEGGQEIEAGIDEIIME